jgi:arginine/lysine/ornithine decarboxylase
LEDLIPKDDPDLDMAIDKIQLDPTKVTVDISQSAYTIDEFQQELYDRYNIQVEKTTFSTVTLLITIGTTKSKISRLYDALLRMSKTPITKKKLLVNLPPQIPHISPLGCLPRDAFFEQGERLPIISSRDMKPNHELIGKISCDGIVPYPPGIPILSSGQIITFPILEYLCKLLSAGGGHSKRISVEIHGLTESNESGELCIRVLTIEEVTLAKQKWTLLSPKVDLSDVEGE